MQKVFLQKNLNRLKKQLSVYSADSIFVVSGGKSFSLSGSKDFIDKLLGTSLYTNFSDFNPNPQLQDLERGIALFKQKDYKLIIAIGGGSVMDMAKLISVLSHQNEAIKSIVKGNLTLSDRKTNVLAIPTTAGSGAESTAFSVLYIDKIKYSVANHLILPDCVYLSAEFSMSSDKYLSACSGLDAFSQAVESMWSVNANKASEKYASKAIALVWKNLAAAVNSNDKEAKEEMQKAAFLAGKAINITKTTAPHALSYGFTTYYNIPHGHAVVLSLAFFFRYNYEVNTNDCNDYRGAEYVRTQIEKILNLLDIKIDDFENTLYKYLISIGIETDIKKLIPSFDSSLILKSINPDRLNNNPRKIHTETLHNFLTQ